MNTTTETQYEQSIRKIQTWKIIRNINTEHTTNQRNTNNQHDKSIRRIANMKNNTKHKYEHKQTKTIRTLNT